MPSSLLLPLGSLRPPLRAHRYACLLSSQFPAGGGERWAVCSRPLDTWCVGSSISSKDVVGE